MGENDDDNRMQWIEDRVKMTFTNLKGDKIKKGLNTEENNEIFKEFFSNADSRCALVSTDSVVATTKFPKKIPKNAKVVLFLKVKSGAINDSKTIGDDLIVMELTNDPLAHLEMLLHEIYLPLLNNSKNQKGWGEVASKEIIDMLHNFLSEVTITVGQLKGETCLPLPPSFDSGGGSNNKEKIHLLETAVITWTKQIRSVLNLDPENMMKKGLNPTPDVEIEFWKSKAANLNSIYTQLQGEKIRKVLKFLESNKSTYCNAFGKICKEIISARDEANDNVKYLMTLESWFDRLNNALSFPGLVDLFKPMMHIILLIWKNSQHYNTPARLVVLIREICNSLINQTCKYVSGEEIFRLIEALTADKAVEQLKTTLKVCGTFKTTYFDYKATANSECPTNQWRIQNNALFMRLDSFLERCHDILDLTMTIVQFAKLERIVIGGTKGKTLSTSVEQIHSDFKATVDKFKNLPYDIMDVGAKQFDDDFYDFRCSIKELERRLGSVITQAFDDSNTIYSRFKLLDSFEGLLERQIIQDELEKKHVVLVQSYGKDLKAVQELFVKDKDEPPIGSNLPPIAGALAWCQGLTERIDEPMEKLKQLNKTITDREEAKEVMKVYDMIKNLLQDYKTEKISEWVLGVENTSNAKLKLNLLVRNEQTRMLAVNFDPMLVRLLREVKYFLLLGLEAQVPDVAKTLYKKSEEYRQFIGNLDLIVNMYNNIMATLLPVEEPLIKTYIDKVDTIIQKGVKQMSWNSQRVDIFITEAKQSVKDANSILTTLKGNLDGAKTILTSWAVEPLLKRAGNNKALTVEEFKTINKAHINAKFEEIKRTSKDMHNFIKESNKILKVSPGLPDWRAYIDFVNNIVVSGLAEAILKSMNFVAYNIDMESISTNSISPMIEIELNLSGTEVVFIPSIGETSDEKGIRDLVNNWIDTFLSISTLFRRLDNGNGSYLKEVQENLEVQMMLATINDHFDTTAALCAQYRQQFLDFSYLWKTNIDQEFADFLKGAVIKTESGAEILDLKQFSNAMLKYKNIAASVEQLPIESGNQCGWIRINSNPVRLNITKTVGKWINMFSQYLQNFLSTKLSNINHSIETITLGLEEDVKGRDKDALMRVMGHIRDAKYENQIIRDTFGPLRDVVALLKANQRDQAFEVPKIGDQDALEFLEKAPQMWERVCNISTKKKEDIMPFQNSEAENIKDEVAKFFEIIRAFRNDFRANAPFKFDGTPQQAYDIMSGFQKQLSGLDERKDQSNRLEDLFDLKKTVYNETKETLKELIVLKNLWDFKALLLHTFDSWEKQLWSDVDTDKLEDDLKKLSKYLKNFSTKNNIVKAYGSYKDVETLIKNMQTVIPMINALHGQYMQDRHWKALSQACNVKSLKHKDPKFCLKNLFDLKLYEHVEDVDEIVDTAGKELKVEKKLKSIEEAWISLQVQFVPHKDSEVKLVKAPDEVMETLEAHTAELQSMIAMGKAVEYFKDSVLNWQGKLGTVELVLKNWLAVTKQWASLESIFLASADIRAQLPEDTKRFEALNNAFMEMMKSSYETPNVIEVCTVEGRAELLKDSIIPDLEKCQKSLSEYLDAKKKIFPRFYFVSDVALLEMLSNGNNPPMIMKYIGDCYDSLNEVIMEPGTINKGNGMIAKDGEKVMFQGDKGLEQFEFTGGVEFWLNDLTEMMQNTLKTILHQSVLAQLNWEHGDPDPIPRHKWLEDYCAQVVLTSCGIAWTEETERSLEELESGTEDAVMNYVLVCNFRLQKLIELVRGELTSAERCKIIALITMDVHGRDVVQRLVDLKAEGPLSFQWQQQLRFAYEPDLKDTRIKITDYKTLYSYEYVGNTGRLVITPLTDRCYITLTMALRLMLGGAPAGPAGTGKTETTKDLGRALALPVYVFNCSDQMNYQTMANIFKGLAQSGSWGCFDEFNRIPIEVLSVVATQVKACLDAIIQFYVPERREEKYQSAPRGQPPVVVGHFELNGDYIQLIPTVGFFITMNPGYAGRTELPENVKALFRSCAMIRPDLQPICENMLMAEGFVEARPLAVKFVRLYALSSELLSPQVHYDWGLRSVKSVLRVAGSLYRAERELSEEGILMRALRDFNTPKMPNIDLPIYLRLIRDLFPKMANLPVKLDPELKKKAIAFCKNPKNNLQPDDGFIGKVVNFQELLDVRHSVMLLGPSGSGKTKIWQCLLGCSNLDKPKAVAIAKVVNPKAVSTDELYGCMKMGNDWKDGVLSIIMRGMSKCNKDLGYSDSQTVKWVVLDDDIDAVWIESMNTVMDDNKVLTLVSNERVPLTAAMRMVFEIDSLKNATPATVSRAGILFINEADVGWRPFVESWLVNLKDERLAATLPGLFDKYIDAIVEMVRKGYKKIVSLYLINQIMTLCYLVQGLLSTLNLDKTASIPASTIENFFIFSAIWAFGGPMKAEKNEDSRKKFHEDWQSLFPHAKIVPNDTKDLTIFDYYFDPVANEFAPWKNKLTEYSHIPIGNDPGQTTFNKIFVQTEDSLRLSSIADILIKVGRSVMFVGTAGTGKTSILNNYLSTLDTEKFITCNISMNYFMNSQMLQKNFEDAVERRSGTTYGPPSGKKLIYFLDDMNLPYLEEYGTQNALSLLRQQIDYKFFYDRADLGVRKDLVDVQFVASMNPTAGSFTVSDRVQIHFSTFACMMPSDRDVQFIYSNILKGHFSTGNFNPKIQDMADILTKNTIDLHAQVSNSYLPTAKTFTYNWNMREMSNIFQGLCLANPQYFNKPEMVTRLWLHECKRVFQDRMIDESEMNRFNDFLVTTSKKFEDEHGSQEAIHALPLLFTSFVSPQNIYLPVPVGEAGYNQLRTVVEGKLTEYNETFAVMDLVLFQQAIEHVARISRIINNPAGCAMLIGVGGSGKQSLSKLSAFISGLEVKMLTVTANFKVDDLKEYLKQYFILAGVKNIPLCWIMTDSQIVQEKFLVYINDVLATGWISDLFAKDELDGALGSIRNDAKAAGVSEVPREMLDFLISRVRKNLHVVLCFSPVGDTFRVRARRFPGLINYTSINYFHPWPRDALVSVSQRFIADIDLGEINCRDEISHHMAHCHLSVNEISLEYIQRLRRYIYVTPKSFLELINFYKMLLAKKQTEISAQAQRLDDGNATLRQTKKDVDNLQIDLNHTMAEVEREKSKTDILIKDMGVEKLKAQEQEKVAAEEQAKADSAAGAAAIVEAEATEKLAEAQPAMNAAIEAVKGLDKSALSTLKSLANPPAGVDDVTAAVIILLQDEYKKIGWDAAKKLMASVDQFISRLEAFSNGDEAKTISDKKIAAVEKYLANPDFSVEKMQSKSSAAANLCKWVHSIYNFNRIYITFAPLMARKDEAQRTKKEALDSLDGVKKLVAAVQEKLAQLQATFMAATAAKAEIEEKAAKCLDKLNLANRLINGLSSEGERWDREVKNLHEQKARLVGDVLLSSAFSSYCGGFDAAFREKLWKDTWLPDLVSRGIPLSDSTDPLGLLATEKLQATMLNEGLPADRISLENGSIINCCKRWPLMIDPQLQGIKWLRKKCGDDAKYLNLSKKNWLKQMKEAIEKGSTVVIENLGEDIDPTLDPVLSRAFFKKGRSLCINIGGEDGDYDPKFQLFLQTKLTNPHYKPETQAQCTMINFIATERGLEDQLLAKVVQAEKPELEQEKQLLQDQNNKYKIQLLDLENALLVGLANAPDDILSDIPLIETIEKTKKTAVEIQIAVAKAKETEIGINLARENYRSVATEGAFLYFTLTLLVQIDHMYQYSLDAFVAFFYKAIDRAEKHADQKERVLALRTCLRLTIYTWVARGLSEDHKLILMAQITFQLLRRGIIGEEGLNLDFFNFLLRAPREVGGDANPLGEWLPDSAWQCVAKLAGFTDFAKLPNDLKEAAPRFKEWFNHVTPERERLPLDWGQLDKTPLLKMLVVRALRPDRCLSALSEFVRKTLPLGDQFVDCDSSLNSLQILEQSYFDSSTTTPIYFILSPGADVVGSLDKLADKMGMVKGATYHNVSMGQGQDIIAEALLDAAHKQGHWVICNNVHLMPKWLGEVEKRLDGYAIEQSHKNFRVFMSSDPSNAIPIGILNRSIKLSNQPPAGLKANLKRAFCSFTKEQHDEFESKSKAIIFGLCHFHSLMMERKKFGPKGFNMMYPFSLGDLRDSTQCLQNYMENSSGNVPWQDLRYIFGEIMYGGHIVNDFDRLLCASYLEHIMKDELLDESELMPFIGEEKISFMSPNPASYDKYLAHIDAADNLDTPMAFGLHPNAEIDFRTTQADNLFNRLQELQPRDASAGDGNSPQDIAQNALQTIKDAILGSLGEANFEMDDIEQLIEEKGPFQNVFLQECNQMNALLTEMRRSMEELEKGFAGTLTMSDAMDKLQNNLYLGRVPVSWAKLAWPSLRSLPLWVPDMMRRIEQLKTWTTAPNDVPICTWLSGLFNPQSFLTAIMQKTAQSQNLELDKLIIQTDITKRTVDDCEAASRDGNYVYGLGLEGARWDSAAGNLDRARPREMFFPMPVIVCKAIPIDKQDNSQIFMCPVYKTVQRGPTYVFSAQLKSKSPSARWVMAGCALIMDFS